MLIIYLIYLENAIKLICRAIGINLKVAGSIPSQIHLLNELLIGCRRQGSSQCPPPRTQKENQCKFAVNNTLLPRYDRDTNMSDCRHQGTGQCPLEDPRGTIKANLPAVTNQADKLA